MGSEGHGGQEGFRQQLSCKLFGKIKKKGGGGESLHLHSFCQTKQKIIAILIYQPKYFPRSRESASDLCSVEGFVDVFAAQISARAPVLVSVPRGASAESFQGGNADKKMRISVGLVCHQLNVPKPLSPGSDQ